MLKDKNEIRVGIDIGGTFTDFVLFDSNRQKLVLHKSLTTPSDPSHGAMLGIEALLEKSNLELQVKWCGKGPVIDVTLMSVIYDQCQLSLTDISKN